MWSHIEIFFFFVHLNAEHQRHFISENVFSNLRFLPSQSSVMNLSKITYITANQPVRVKFRMRIIIPLEIHLNPSRVYFFRRRSVNL